MAAEPEDVFLRHRSAVLEVLLSAATLGEPADPSTAAPPQSTPHQPQALAPLEIPPDFELGPDPLPTPAQPTPAVPSRASARINALLNGQPDERPATTELAAHTATRATPRTTPPGNFEPDPPRAATDGGGARAAALLTRAQRLVRTRSRTVALIAGVLVVCLLFALLNRPGPENHPAALITAPTSAAPAVPSTTSAVPAAQTQIQVRAAQSRCPPGSTPGLDAFGGVPGKAWSCVRAYQVDGQVLRIDLGGTFEVATIAIVPGWDHIGADGADQWTRYRTVSRVSYRFDDAATTTYTQETLDQRGSVATTIEPPVRASHITLTILKSSGEPSINITAISSIVITGR